MHFEPDQIYHVYNRGNNKTRIFFDQSNYLYFLRKVRSKWLLYCDLFCYCLMPNHFHFMLQSNKRGCETSLVKGRSTGLQNLSRFVGHTLSSYTQAINIQNNTTGNLFQKKTKAKCLTDDEMRNAGYIVQDYPVNCFNYIHSNPLKAGLVKDPKDWPYSSWLDYYGNRSDGLCNKELAMAKLGMSLLDFDCWKKPVVDEKIIELIW